MRNNLRAAAAAFSPQEQAVFRALRSGKDVHIMVLHAQIAEHTPDLRRMQQRLGATFSRLNRKLAPFGYKIAPGTARKTYKLYDTRGE